MADWSNPTVTSLYTEVLTNLKDRDLDAATQFNNGTPTNVPTNAIRWNGTLGRWQMWSGTAWAELAATYSLTGLVCTSLSTTGNTTLGDAAADSVTVNAGTMTFANPVTIGGSLTFSGGLIASSTAQFGTSVSTGYGASTASVVFEHGGDRSGNGDAVFDFHATSGTDFEARLARLSGANGALQINNTGTGELQIRQTNAGDVVFYTANTERLRITSGGSIDPTSGIKARVTSGTAVSSSWNSDSVDLIAATAQAADVTIGADSGTPTNGRKVLFRVLDNGTPRIITFTGGVSKGFRPVGSSLTASGSNWTYTTKANKEAYIGCVYNSRADRWDIIAIAEEV